MPFVQLQIRLSLFIGEDRVAGMKPTLIFLLTLSSCPPLVGAEREWPFHSLRPIKPMAVKNQEWIHNGIDSFILGKLEAKGLAPAPKAGKRILVRRLHFDLIGLPPLPEEVDSFVKDADPTAYEKLVDRLLKDPRYGERWARLWLDLARYADTAGYEGDPDMPHAWRYRDYVTDAFNADKPYDLFIKEQIAGDEFSEIMGAGDLPKTKPEHTVALTFLRLAPFTEPRGDESRHELLSEMTSTVSSVFLGLTVGCAQCHDHKYDQIPTKDFYRMQAFFSTVQIERPLPGDRFQIGGPLSAAFYRKEEKAWSEKMRTKFNGEIATSKVDFKKLTALLQKKLGNQGAGFGMQSMGGNLGNNYFYDVRNSNDGKMHHVVVNAASSGWKFYTDGKAVAKLESLSGTNGGHAAGSGHKGQFSEILIYDHPLSEDERFQISQYVNSHYQTGKSAFSPPVKGMRFWLDARDLDANPATANPKNGTPISKWIDKVSGVALEQSKAKLQPKLSPFGKSVAATFEGSFLHGDGAKAAFAKDKQGSLVVVFSATHQGEGYGFEVGGNKAFISTVSYPKAGEKNSLESAINDINNPTFTAEERARYYQLKNAEAFIKQRLKRLEPVAMSLRHSYGPPYEPGVPVTRVKIRGEYDNLGAVVQAGFPSAITGHQKPADIRLDPFKRWPTRSRRMALAKWISSRDNPLTARVMVNRLWHWHFDQGIVKTPSDFGKLSGGPSHPELIDWLANEFVKSKWSIKAMHRLIVTSTTYRQSSQNANPKAATLDPDNSLFWKFRRQRLTGEMLRDAILFTSGRLNPEQFGLPIFPPLPGGIEQAVKFKNSKWDTQYGPEGRKRSIYIYQQRTLTMPFLQNFDALVCDESRPRRRASVTPLQALAMYNGHLVNEEAPHLAKRIREKAGKDVAAQIDWAFQFAFARHADAPELAKLQTFMKSAPAEGDPLVRLCRVLLNSNEFVYLD